MFNHDKLKETIQALDELHPNNDFGIETQYRFLIALLSENIEDTIDYFEQCTAHELTWLNCVFDDVIEKTQSAKLLVAMHKLVDKLEHHPDAKRYPIKDNMRFADGALSNEAYAEFEKMMEQDAQE